MEINIRWRIFKMSVFLKKELEDSVFNFTQLDENILVIEDFLSVKELEEVLRIIEETKQEDWEIEYRTSIRRFCLEKFGRDDVENLVLEGKFEITFDWADKTIHLPRSSVLDKIDEGILKIISYDPNLYYNYSGTLQRQYEGSDLKVHVDNHVDPYIAYAAVVYLNDDYTHGEVIFPKQGLELKPKPGSMLFFSSTDTHPHGVNPPGPGPLRYVLPSFIKQTELPEGFVHSPSDIHLQYQTHKRY
jgi:hypothetical protein